MGLHTNNPAHEARYKLLMSLNKLSYVMQSLGLCKNSMWNRKRLNELRIAHACQARQQIQRALQHGSL